MKQPQIILLHGIGRSPRTMAKLATTFKLLNYRVFNPGYNSYLDSYQEILTSLQNRINDWIEKDAVVHFVGHSFGGILIRGLLSHNQNHNWHLGRCVMLGTPNQGTQSAKFMLSHWLIKYFVPKVTADLVPASQFLKALPEPEIETGIIAGSVNFSIVIPNSWFYKKATDNAPGDGIVELINTQCKVMADYRVMPLQHSFMTNDKSLIMQVVHFIEFGKFNTVAI